MNEPATATKGAQFRAQHALFIVANVSVAKAQYLWLYLRLCLYLPLYLSSRCIGIRSLNCLCKCICGWLCICICNCLCLCLCICCICICICIYVGDFRAARARCLSRLECTLPRKLCVKSNVNKKAKVPKQAAKGEGGGGGTWTAATWGTVVILAHSCLSTRGHL